MSARERPISFSASTVRALLSGATQTRRPVSVRPCPYGREGVLLELDAAREREAALVAAYRAACAERDAHLAARLAASDEAGRVAIILEIARCPRG